MRNTILLSALAFALAAPSPTRGQSSTASGTITQTASLSPFPVAWTAIATARPVDPATASPAADPAPAAAGFVAILSIPCTSPASNSNSTSDHVSQPCLETPDPYTRFLDTTTPVPLSPWQKAHLALRNLTDPGNIATIAWTAAFTVATNSHSAYGPGWNGYTRAIHYSFSQDATGEFFGTFLIPSLAHQDPHYHRMPDRGVPRRIVNALSHTVIAQSDTGRPMPNYATLLTYPIAAEIGNLYVPGINGNGPSTVDRILTGYATDPVDNLITEFLPDLARHIHIRVVFVQSILNQVSSDQYSLPGR